MKIYEINKDFELCKEVSINKNIYDLHNEMENDGVKTLGGNPDKVYFLFEEELDTYIVLFQEKTKDIHLSPSNILNIITKYNDAETIDKYIKASTITLNKLNEMVG